MKEMPSRHQKEKVLKMSITCHLVIVPSLDLVENAGVTQGGSEEPSLWRESSNTYVFLEKVRRW